MLAKRQNHRRRVRALGEHGQEGNQDAGGAEVHLQDGYQALRQERQVLPGEQPLLHPGDAQPRKVHTCNATVSPCVRFFSRYRGETHPAPPAPPWGDCSPVRKDSLSTMSAPVGRFGRGKLGLPPQPSEAGAVGKGGAAERATFRRLRRK